MGCLLDPLAHAMRQLWRSPTGTSMDGASPQHGLFVPC